MEPLFIKIKDVFGSIQRIQVNKITNYYDYGGQVKIEFDDNKEIQVDITADELDIFLAQCYITVKDTA
jgi:hypothetical protein